MTQSGKEALALIADSSAAAFDVVLSDLNMPEMDGRAFLRELRAKGFHIPVVAITADTDPGMHIALRREGFDTVLAKPLTAGDLNKVFFRVGAAKRAEKHP